jgi:hypothetical protein
MNDLRARYTTHVFTLVGLSSLWLSGCGLEHLFGGVTDTEHEPPVSVLRGTTTNMPKTVIVQKPDGQAVEPLSAAITGTSFVLELPAAEYTNSRLIATAGESRLEAIVPLLAANGSVEVALGAKSTAEVLVLDASMSAQGKTLTLLSPGIVRSGLGQITNLLASTDGTMFVGMVTELLGKADPAKDTRILRAPAYDTNYRATQSTVDPAWLATVSGVSTTTTTFEAALTALITSSTVTPASRINLGACLDPVNVRVVFEVDFADGRKDGNCDVISRFRWVRDEPGKSMFFVGGFHKESPIQDPQLDAQMSNSGGWVPNQVQMYDDGTNGDGVAGDNVWTFAIALPRGSRIGYKYTWGTRGALWTGSEEWPGNQHILEIVDVDGDNIVYRRDNFGDEATNKDKANLNRRGRGEVTWDTDVNGDGIPDTRERPLDLDNDCVLDEFQSPKGIGPATVDCQ